MVQRHSPALRPRDRKAFDTDFRALYARSRNVARCSGGPLSRRAGAFSGRSVLAPGGFGPADPRQFSRRGAPAPHRSRYRSSALSMIPLACLLPGEFNRRGQLNRVLLAIGLALVFQALDLVVKNLAGRHVAAIPLMYLTDLLPLALGVWNPAVRRDQDRRLAASRRRRDNQPRLGRRYPVHLRKDSLRLYRPPVLRVVLRRIRRDGQRDASCSTTSN